MRLFTAAVALLLLSPSVFADAPSLEKKKHAKAEKKENTSQYYSEVVDHLIAAGLSQAAAEKLARRIIAGDKDAIETAKRIGDAVADMQRGNVPPDQYKKVTEEINRRGLTDSSAGGASDNLTALPMIDALLGEGASKRLPDWAHPFASKVSTALADAAAEMQLGGLKPGDPEYDAVIDKILGKGLVGSEARKLVDEAVNNPKKGTVEPTGAPTGGPPGTTPGPDTPEPDDPPLRDIIPDEPHGSDGRDPTARDGEVTPDPTPAPRSPDQPPSDDDDPPPVPPGSDESPWRPGKPRDGSDQLPAPTPTERPESSDTDDEDAEPTPAPTPPPSEDQAGTSLDPGGDQAYHGKYSLSDLLDRITKIHAKQGHTTNPDPNGADAPDRTVRIKDPKPGLIGNPGGLGSMRPSPIITRDGVQGPGPKPGQVDPPREEQSNRGTSNESKKTGN